MPHLVRLIYASRSAGPAPIHARDILNAARAHNEKHEISGALLVGPSHFLQALEGSRTAVNEVYLRISRDTRHADVTLLSYGRTHVRFWPRWGMKFVSDTELARTAESFGTDIRVFDPFEIDSEYAERLVYACAEPSLQRTAMNA